jgi:hypothetical protein
MATWVVPTKLGAEQSALALSEPGTEDEAATVHVAGAA